jgi:hypothetical protein
MGRKATDLLDVFRLGGGAGGGAPAGKRPAPRAAAAKTPRAKGGSFEGVFLTPRQLVLGGSVALLALVLAFTLGLGFGRKGSGAATAPAPLSRTTAWFVRGRFEATDPLRGRIRPDDVLGHLEQVHRIERRFVKVQPRESGGWWIFVGPFATDREAREYHGQMDLELIRGPGGYPFRDADIVNAPLP